MDKETYDQYEMQRALQQQSIDAQAEMYAPSMKQQINDMQSAVIQQVNPVKVAEKIILRFEGKILRDDEIVEKFEPVMNQKGISEVSLYLEGIINQSLTMGKLEDEEIKNIAVGLSHSWTENIGFNWRRWGIKNASTKDMICDILAINTLAILKRSRDEKAFFGKVAIEHITQAKSPKKEEGFLSKIRL